MVEKVIESFKKYVSNYDMNIMQISLKYNHSFEVMNLMGELAFRLNLDKEKIELARVIGLLHDIGRFEQFTRFESFNDSNIDHAELSVKYLFEENHIRDFIELDKYDDIIKAAIKYHNSYKIPSNLEKDELLFAKMIRDMDKVDIYHQAAINYNYVFNASEVNEKVLTDFKDAKSII